MYKDSGTGELGDEIGLLARMNKLDPHKNFRAVLKIYQDIVNGKGKGKGAREPRPKHPSPHPPPPQRPGRTLLDLDPAPTSRLKSSPNSGVYPSRGFYLLKNGVSGVWKSLGIRGLCGQGSEWAID